MAEPLGLTLYGLGSSTHVDLVGDGAADLLAAARHAWARCLEPRPGDVETTEGLVATTDPHAVLGGGRIEVSATDQRALLQALTQQVTHAKIRAQSGRLLLMHAGAAADPLTGRTVAFVAPGGTGKTTLMRHLCTTLGYLTDETCGVTAEHLVLPYQKPLSIRVRPGVLTKGETAPGDLGLLPAPETPRLHRIVLLARSTAHEGAARLEGLPLAEVLSSLAPETSALSLLPRPLHWLAALLDGLAPTVRLHYREVETLDALVPALWGDA